MASIKTQVLLEESELIAAIANTTQSQLLVATWSKSQGNLYHLRF